MEPKSKVVNSSRPAVRIYTAAEVMQRPMPGWLIDGILPENGLAMLYGPPGVGKTFVALGLAKSIVADEPWLGKFRVRPGSVLYIAAEGGGGLRKRLEAHAFPKTGRNALFLLDPVYLSDPAHRVALIDTLGKETEATLRLIVIDTLGMSFTGDENSAQDIGELMRGATEVRNKTGATILLIHHSVKTNGKKKGVPSERGSSALLGALDTSMALVPFDGQLRLVCKKQKDAEPFDPIDLVLTPVNDSCVIEAGLEFPDAELSSSAVKALRALDEAYQDNGAGLRAKDWRQAAGLPESTFFKATGELLRRGLVEKGPGQLNFVSAAGAALLSAAPIKLSA